MCLSVLWLSDMQQGNARSLSDVLETCRVRSATRFLVDKLPWLKFEISGPAVKLENISEAPPSGLDLDWMTFLGLLSIVGPKQIQFENLVRTALLDSSLDIAT